MTRKNYPRRNEKLDRAGRRLVIASVLPDEIANSVVESPFLFSQIRARIASQQESSQIGGVWAGFWLISRRAIPAMGLVAALSFGLFLYTGRNKSASSTFSVDAYLGTSDTEIEGLVFAERRPLTDEEVLSTIVANDEREPAR